MSPIVSITGYTPELTSALLFLELTARSSMITMVMATLILAVVLLRRF